MAGSEEGFQVVRFNPDGRLIAGGMASVHVNGVVLALPGAVRAGNPQWRDASRLVCQIEKSGDKGRLYELAAPSTGTPTLVDDKPSSQIVAGGGQWAAWNVADGYRDSHGKKARWYPVACDDLSGVIAVVTDQQAAVGLNLWNGSALTPVATGPIGEACFRGGLLVYRDRGQLKACDVAGKPVRVANPPGLAGVQHAGDYLLLGRDNGPSRYDLCLVRKSDATRSALVVSSPDADFYADLRVMPNGRVEVVSSPNQGDTLPIQRYIVNPSTVTWRPIGTITPPTTKPPTPKPEPLDDGDDMADPELIARLTRIETKIDRLLDALDEPPQGDEPHDPPPSDPEVPVIDIAAVTWLNSGNPLDFRVTSRDYGRHDREKERRWLDAVHERQLDRLLPAHQGRRLAGTRRQPGCEVRGQRLRLRAYRQPLVRRRRGVAEGQSNLQAPVESIGTRLVGHRPAHEERSAPVVGTDVRGMDRDHGLHARTRWRGR